MTQQGRVAATLVDAIDALLPQTQCTKCGYAGCRPYAEAIADGGADINQCPPGGIEGIANLAALLHREVKPLNPSNGVEQAPVVALIDETWCIGCTLCIQACPVDAIVGAPKQMHVVLLEQCTGCELCVPPCPVDCIRMVETDDLRHSGVALPDPGRAERALRARDAYALHQRRVEREHEERAAGLAARAEENLGRLQQQEAKPRQEPKRAAVQAALERARARRGTSAK